MKKTRAEISDTGFTILIPWKLISHRFLEQVDTFVGA